jgi:hypothetical protein
MTDQLQLRPQRGARTGYNVLHSGRLRNVAFAFTYLSPFAYSFTVNGLKIGAFMLLCLVSAMHPLMDSVSDL